MDVNDMSEEEYMAAFPFVVVSIETATQAWSICSHPTMRLALLQPQLAGHSNVVFGSWDDYYEWKRLRLAAQKLGILEQN